jgi:hypothetical protein
LNPGEPNSPGPSSPVKESRQPSDLKGKQKALKPGGLQGLFQSGKRHKPNLSPPPHRWETKKVQK